MFEDWKFWRIKISSNNFVDIVRNIELLKKITGVCNHFHRPQCIAIRFTRKLKLVQNFLVCLSQIMAKNAMLCCVLILQLLWVGHCGIISRLTSSWGQWCVKYGSSVSSRSLDAGLLFYQLSVITHP